jgi:hypothetical protein
MQLLQGGNNDTNQDMSAKGKWEDIVPTTMIVMFVVVPWLLYEIKFPNAQT